MRVIFKVEFPQFLRRLDVSCLPHLRHMLAADTPSLSIAPKNVALLAADGAFRASCSHMGLLNVCTCRES